MSVLEPIYDGTEERKKNKGFSLIEVLVSMLVLAIIIAPILGNIMQASRMNQKSRDIQDVSYLGQNMMEGFKSQASFEDVAKQLIFKDKGVDFDLFPLENVDSVVTGQIQYDATSNTYLPVADPCITRTVDPTTSDYIYSLKENASREYLFKVSNILYNNKKYCAKITYNAASYSKEDPSEDDKYNDVDMPVLPAVSDDKNAVVALRYQDEWAASTLKQKYNVYFNSTFTDDNNVTNEDIKNDMKRTLTITISYDVTKNKYLVKGEFTYTLNTLIPTGDNKYEDVFYQQEFSELENIYLFFAPNLVMKQDVININNKLTDDAADLNVYLVEQQKDGVIESGTYESLINQYWLTVYLTETKAPLDPLNNEYIYHTKFRTNLGSAIDGFDGMSRIIFAGITKEKLRREVLIERDEDKTRIYNITVDLYREPESSSPMFQEDDYITTFTSSKGE